VICSQVRQLKDKLLLVPSSERTLLDDDVIMARFQGDKGSNFMQFKYGVTIINGADPNSPDEFDLCGTLDAPDSYSNLRAAMFEQWEEELEFLFSVRPRLFLLTMIDEEGETALCSFVLREEHGNTPLWESRTTTTLEQQQSKVDETCGPFTVDHAETRMKILVDSRYREHLVA